MPDVPGPDHARFAGIRPFFRQRKDDAERRRREQLEQRRRKIEGVADTRIRRELERKEAECQRGIDAFWHAMSRKVRDANGVERHGPKQDRGVRRGHGARGRHIASPPFALAAYNSPILDRRGRAGVFMSSTYLSARTSAYGCMRRLSYYVTKPESLETLEGENAFFSNMGETRHEIATGMELVEDANRAARANGKVAVTFIVQLPHDVTPGERLRILRTWCEAKLGVHDLPYVAALHKPSREGDQRNYHGHVVTSFRPAYRTGRYDWRIARGLRTDLDNPAMFEAFRRDFATIMTAVVQIAGKDRVYTHLSHAARGLKHKPTEKLGPHKTKAVRKREHVPANARNARTIATNEALEEVARIDERAASNHRWIARLAALKASLVRSLSPAIEPPARNRALPVRSIAAPYSPSVPPISNALLAAAERAARPPAAAAAIVHDAPVVRQPFRHVDPDRRAASGHRLSAVLPVAPVRKDVRDPSNPAEPRVYRYRSKNLPRVPAVEPSTGRVSRPSSLPTIDRPPTVTTQSLSPVVEPSTARAKALQLSLTPIIAPRRVPPMSSIASAIGAERSRGAAARIPARIRAVSLVPPEPARALDISAARIRNLDARASEIERAKKARAERAAIEAADKRQRREHERFLRFLALIALNPDWLEDGDRGLAIAPHTPPEVHDADVWGKDHARRDTIADVRQAVIDGMHQLPSDLANDLARRMAEFAPRLPAPPPLRDANRRPAPAIEVAMALVADHPGWVSASGDLARLSPSAAPALTAIVARYRQDRSLGELLAAARRHGEGIAGALNPALARRIDQRRAGMALRRIHGDLRVTEPDGKRLSPAMVEHLAQARLHPQWIVRDPHLGLGLGAGASPMFRRQWNRWSDPVLARQLLLDNAEPATTASVLTPAMRAQVLQRVGALAGTTPARTQSRSHERDGPSR